MDPATLSNLGAYAIQIACIAGAAALAAWLFNPGAPGVRYAFWRIVTLAALALPWIQGRIAPAAAARVSAGTTSETTSLALADPSASGAAAAASVDWVSVALGVFALGVVLRLAWMAAGLFQLRRMRAIGVQATPSDAVNHLLRVIGTTADIRYVEGLVQPVTFGVRRPVVLLPSALGQQPDEIQAAVLGHELLHVQRRDWAWVLAEELVRAVFWFHPAVWWMVSRIQLAREEVVDELAVLATGRRRTYVEALLAFADEWPLAPAPAFARRRHLFRRVTLLSKEVVMSSKRVVTYCAAMALVVAAGGWSAVTAFPLHAEQTSTWSAGLAAMEQKPGPLETRAQPVGRENPLPPRTYYVPAVYPIEAAMSEALGTATLKLTLDEGGNVAEARMIGVSSSAGGARVSFSAVSETDIRGFAAGSGAAANPALQLLPAFINSALDAVRQWRYDPPANPPVSFTVVVSFKPASTTTSQPHPGVAGGVSGGVRGGVAGGIQGGVSGGIQGGVSGEGARRVGGSIKAPIKVKDVRPIYPPDARDAGVQGVVIIEARIEADGHVSDARVLRSIRPLDQAAIDAVMQWEFTPTLLNGVAMPVIMAMTVNFTLK